MYPVNVPTQKANIPCSQTSYFLLLTHTYTHTHTHTHTHTSKVIASFEAKEI